jgi:tetratricopeptide (TPR) repeat protein
MHIPANALLVAFLFGILANAASDSPVESPRPVQSAGGWRWVLAAIGALVAGLSIRYLPGEIYAEKARVALRDDQNADAVIFARQGIAWEKKNPNLYAYLGEAEHFLTLDAQDPASARLQHEDALAAYEAGLRLFPQDTGLLLKKAQVLDLLERFPEAEEVFQRLFHSDPFFENVYAFYGLHWQLQKRMGAAERCFRLAVQLGETNIAPRALQKIERMKTDPIAQSLMYVFPDPDLDLPAERVPSKL